MNLHFEPRDTSRNFSLLSTCSKVSFYPSNKQDWLWDHNPGWVLRSSTGSEVILHTNKGQEANREMFTDKETGQEMELVDQGSFLEWLAENYKNFGATLEFVSDRSSEGNQFVKGFGGIGAMLRYKLNFEQLAEIDSEDEFYDDWRFRNLATESEDAGPDVPSEEHLTALRDGPGEVVHRIGEACGRAGGRFVEPVREARKKERAVRRFEGT